MGRGSGSSRSKGGGAGWDRGLTSQEEAAIRAYTGHEYSDINGYLRGHNMDPAAIASILEKVSHLDSALAKAALAKDTRVYRGISDLRNLGLSERTLVGATIHDKGFMSTSTSRESARAFGGTMGGVLVRIRAPKGSRGGSVKRLSIHKGEGEVLFARGSRVRITRARKTKSGVLVARGVLE